METHFSHPSSSRRPLKTFRKKKAFDVFGTQENISQKANVKDFDDKDISKKDMALFSAPRRALGDVGNTKKTDICDLGEKSSSLNKSVKANAFSVTKTTNRPDVENVVNTEPKKSYLNLKSLMHSEVYPDYDDYDDIWPCNERVTGDMLGKFMQNSRVEALTDSRGCEKDDILMPDMIPIQLENDWNNSELQISMIDDEELLPIEF